MANERSSAFVVGAVLLGEEKEERLDSLAFGVAEALSSVAADVVEVVADALEQPCLEVGDASVVDPSG